MSAAHLPWLVTGSTLSPMILVLRFWNSGLKFGHVAKLGGANGREVLWMREQTAHPSPIHSWKSIVPCVVSAVKSGACH